MKFHIQYLGFVSSLFLCCAFGDNLFADHNISVTLDGTTYQCGSPDVSYYASFFSRGNCDTDYLIKMVRFTGVIDEDLLICKQLGNMAGEMTYSRRIRGKCVSSFLYFGQACRDIVNENSHQ